MDLTIEVPGRATYISVHDAAREAEVSKNHIANSTAKDRLGRLIAGMWFVDHKQLRSYFARRAKKHDQRPSRSSVSMSNHIARAI